MRGNFERDKIPIVNIAITEGIIATSLYVEYGIRSKGPKISKLAEAPLRIITIMVNPNSDLANWYNKYNFHKLNNNCWSGW